MSIQKLLRRALPEHFAPSLRTTIILLASSLVFGLCHVAALPPFEGFDEYQHYAYIQQIAKTGTWPRFGDKASRYIEDYVAFAPGPLAGGAKYDYADFFAGNADRIEEVRRAVNDAREPPPSVEPGTVPNWEAQHPPLFYALLAPFYLASQTWSLGHQLLLLRSGSYLLAWLSLCVAVIAAARHGPVASRAFMVIAPALWPFMFPGWFPEMARIGNDSLVALLVALAIFVVLHQPRRQIGWVGLGVICGLGALTKAIFLPFLAAIGAFLAYQVYCRKLPMRSLLTLVITTALVAGWWYWLRYAETGMLFATNDALTLRDRGGLLQGLAEPGSIGAILWDIPVIGGSFLWSGTWSFSRPPIVALVPLAVLAALFGYIYVRELIRQKDAEPIVKIPLWIIAITAFAFLHPILITVAAYGRGIVPGWYLHALAAALAPVIGVALASATKRPWSWLVVIAGITYGAVYLVGATLLQLLFFSGCGRAIEGRFLLSSAPHCWIALPALLRNLSILSNPVSALLLMAIAVVLMGVGLIGVGRLAGAQGSRR